MLGISDIILVKIALNVQKLVGASNIAKKSIHFLHAFKVGSIHFDVKMNVLEIVW